MSIEIKQHENGMTDLLVNDEMTIYTVLQQKQILFDQVKLNQHLQIDLSRVSEMDSAGLQLLMFIKQEAESRNVTLSLIQHSQAVVEVIELFNLSKYFGDPIVIAAVWKTL